MPVIQVLKYFPLSFLLIAFCSGAIQNKLRSQNVVDRPNVIIIMADDLGNGDLEAFGGDGSIRTPNINRLVAGGLKLTNYHTSGVVCSPTRASLMTGLYPQEAGIASVVTAAHHRHTGMSPDHYTMAEFFKEAGYNTGIFGKWHLGYKPEFGPVVQGFDQFRGFVSGNIDYFSHIDQEGYADWWKQSELSPEKGYLTDLITDHGIDFINEAQGKPFFLYLAHGAPHYPLQGPNDTAYRTVQGDFLKGGIRTDTERRYKDMIESLDHNIGRILTYLKDKKLLKKTLILFFSDNGAPRNAGSNRPYRGTKGTVYEGGHRVPAVFYWLDVIEPSSTDDLVLTMDVFPTLADILNIDLTPRTKVSGLSVAPLIFSPSKGNENDKNLRTVFWQWHPNQRYGIQKAVRQGPWKLVINNEGTALYNLHKNLDESMDVKSEYPEKLEELQLALERWESSISDAEITVPVIK